MQYGIPTASTRLRVLVVDNKQSTAEDYATLLELWGYQPFRAEGSGELLRDDALAKARRYRCQLALVDMRLFDDHDPRDWSGLELVEQLAPTATIILSGFGDRRSAVAALRKYGAHDFLGKEESPDDLRVKIQQLTEELAIAPDKRPRIFWTSNMTSATIGSQVCPGNSEVPADEAEELIGRLFPRARRVTLALITGDAAATAATMMRRKSRVFRTTVDDNAAFQVVKLAKTKRIEQELRNYENYVRFNTPGLFRPELVASKLLWDMGAVSYNHVGNAGMAAPGGPQTFTDHYRSSTQVEQIVAPLRHFFDPNNWGYWYRNGAGPLHVSLFEAYDETWNHALSKAFTFWHDQPALWALPELGLELFNPTHWIVNHWQESFQVLHPRQAVTHGDFHGENLFVNDNYAWPIDFERTAYGPILRDFVELIQDLLTRMLPLPSGETDESDLVDEDATEPDLFPLYALAVAVCTPHTPTDSLPLFVAVQQHGESLKAFGVLQAVLRLTIERAQYEDQRELLWGLLFNNLFVTTLLPPDDPRLPRTLLFASILCHRLDQWGRADWRPDEWPQLEQHVEKGDR